VLLTPVPPRTRTRFSGWRVVALAAVALGMTGPGQTAGVSVFVDPMMGALELTRSEVSTAYLIGTLGGAVAMPRVGRLIDDRGARVAMGLVGGVFGVVLAAMAGVVGMVTLVLGFTGIRAFGQGGLSLIATTSVAPWFSRRRGLAIGVTAAVGSALLSLVPILSASVIDVVGWRWAWIVLAVLVWLVVLPIALRGIIDRPSDVGQRVDGDPAPVEAARSTHPVARRPHPFRGAAGTDVLGGRRSGGRDRHDRDGPGLPPDRPARRAGPHPGPGRCQLPAPDRRGAHRDAPGRLDGRPVRATVGAAHLDAAARGGDGGGARWSARVWSLRCTGWPSGRPGPRSVRSRPRRSRSSSASPTSVPSGAW
jgi:hypothetical protein